VKYKNLPISDGHIHTFWDMTIEEREKLLLSLIEEFGYDTVTILDIAYNTTRKTKCRDFTENLSTFYLKSRHPEKIYAFASLTPSFDESNNTPEFFLEQLKFYMEAGFDGLKMIEGRPLQRIVGGPFDSPKYQLVYKYCEDNSIPIVMHSNADERCWRKGGPFEGKWHGQFSWRDYYDDTVAVLKKYPKLRLQIAHFFFASEHPDLCTELFDTFENLYFDICPNQYMYPHFKKKEHIWRPFFEKYQDRIIYGTDIGANTLDLKGDEARELVRMVRGFLEEDDPFTAVGCYIPPMKTPDDKILRKIYKENLMNFYQHKAPKALKPSLMKKEWDTVMTRYFTLLDLKDIGKLKTISEIFEK